MERINSSMTVDQANALTAGLDLSSRIMMGQIDEIATLAKTGRLNVYDERSEGGARAPTLDEIERIEEHAVAIARILGHGRGSFGLGAKGMPLEAKRQYEIKKTVEKVVADLLNPGGMTVHHDGLIVRYTQDPAPRAMLTDGDPVE